MEVEDASQGSGKKLAKIMIKSKDRGRNLKVNDILYKKLAEQREKRNVKEVSKAVEVEEKRKADKEPAGKAKAEEEAAIKKAAKQTPKKRQRRNEQKRESKQLKQTQKERREDDEESEAEDDEDVMSTSAKKVKKVKEEKHVESREENVFYEGSESDNEGFLFKKAKKPAKITKKTQASTSKAYMKKQRKNESKDKECNELKEEEEFDPKEEQSGMDLYKGLGVYTEPSMPIKLVEREERYELIQTLKDGINKFEDHQTMLDFYKDYKQVFIDVHFSLDDFFIHEYNDDDHDSDNDSNNNDENGGPMTKENPTSSNQIENENDKESDNESEKEMNTGDDVEKGNEGASV
ncbi:hypothetical protein Tco_0438609 [Tanacetum coccineum]